MKLVGSYFDHVSNSTKHAQASIDKELQRNDLTKVVISLAEDELALFENEKFIERLKASIQLINRNKEIFIDHLTKKSHVPDAVVLDVTGLTQEITQEISLINERIGNLQKSESEIGEIIASRKASRMVVERNEKLHVSMPLLEEWFRLRDLITEYTKTSKKFSTNSLTQKQGEAFKEIIQSSYIETFDRFAQELRVTNVNIKLNSQKGQTVRKKYVVSEEYKVSDIMSEGEQKAIALVEFATDLTMRRNLNPVLFDDPVTSLDYKRSELIAKLIYQLSLDRQVLVFTHNIMFYYYLYNACAKTRNNENKFFKVDEFDNSNKGIVSETFSGKLETLREITKKLKDQEQRINSKACVGDVLEESLKKAYSDIRTWCELIVEEGFFNSVIQRYEPNIKFTRVTGIKGDFIEELATVNALFEKACRWMTGHSQPAETQHIRATKEAFNEDMVYIKKLSDRYR
ncbi:hypothetical protein C7445_1161 [Alicyclobacillus sacchari]|uniref:Protein CR006 P-loop domain-containing protein n=1 Tax=Alicyclobacillus sacchari TaxID=392010 RepID=A0A4R8LGR0_9BACL|nr:hypothetical protein C7445_1161 [Alicyclobacillus sacchari]